MAGAQSVGVVYYRVEPSAKDWNQKLNSQISDGSAQVGTAQGEKAGKGFGTGFLKNAASGLAKVGKAGLGVITGIGTAVAGLAAKGGISRALNIEVAQTKLKGLGHSTEDITELMNDAMASVKGTAFGLDEAATIAASLSASGIKSGQDMTNTLKTVADTATIAGMSMTDAGAIFGSVAARGKLQGDDMLQLTSRGVPVLQALSDQLHVSTADVSAMVSKGKVDFATFSAAMNNYLGGAALASGNTFQGAMANCKAALSRLGAAAATPALQSLKSVFTALTPVIDDVSKALTPAVDAFTARLTPATKTVTDMLATFDKQLKAGKISIADIATQAATLTGAFATLAVSGKAVPAALSGINGISSIIDGISFDGIASKAGTVKTMLAGMFDPERITFDAQLTASGLSKAGASIGGVLKQIGDEFMQTGIGQKIAGLNASIMSGVKGMASKVSDGLFGVAVNIAVFGASVKERAVGVLGQVATAFQSNPVVAAVGGFGSKILEKFKGIGSMLAQAAPGVATGVTTAVSGIGDTVSAVFGPMADKSIGIFRTMFAPGRFIAVLGIGGIAAGLIAALGAVNASMDGQVSAMITTFLAGLPTKLAGLMQVVQTQVPVWMTAGTQMIMAVVNGIDANLPMLLSLGQQAITTLLGGLAANAPQLIVGATTLILDLVQGIVDNLPQLIQAGLQLIQALGQGLIQAIPVIVAALPQIITSLVLGLVSALPQMLTTAAQLITGLAQGLIAAIPKLIAALPQIIVSLVTGILTHLPEIIEAGLMLMVALPVGFIKALPQIIKALPQIITSIKDAFTKTDWISVGKNIINGIKDGIVKFAKNIGDAAKNAAKDALDAVKGMLGIHSPSRVFRDQVGLNIGRGVAVGIDRSGRYVDASVKQLGARLNPDITLTGYSSVKPADADDPAKTGLDAQATAQDTGAQLTAIGALTAQVAALRAELPGVIRDYTPQMTSRDLRRVLA